MKNVTQVGKGIMQLCFLFVFVPPPPNGIMELELGVES